MWLLTRQRFFRSGRPSFKPIRSGLFLTWLPPGRARRRAYLTRHVYRFQLVPPVEETPRVDATTETEEAVVGVDEEGAASPADTPVIASQVPPPDASAQADVQTHPPEETEAEQPTTRASVTIHPPAERPSRVIALEEAYQLAVVNEEQVAIAARELAKAKLLPWRAVALMAPRGEIGGAYSRNKDEIAFNAPPEARSLFGGSSVIRPRNNWLSTFQVTQPLIEPSFFPSWRLGKDAVREEEERYEFTIRSVLFGVAQAYYEVLRFEAQVKVAQDTLKLAQEELKRAYVRFRVGEVTKTDILRAEVAVERASRALVVDRKPSETRPVRCWARTVGLSETVGVLEPTPPQAVERVTIPACLTRRMPSVRTCARRISAVRVAPRTQEPCPDPLLSTGRRPVLLSPA